MKPVPTQPTGTVADASVIELVQNRRVPASIEAGRCTSGIGLPCADPTRTAEQPTVCPGRCSLELIAPETPSHEELAAIVGAEFTILAAYQEQLREGYASFAVEPAVPVHEDSDHVEVRPSITTQPDSNPELAAALAAEFREVMRQQDRLREGYWDPDDSSHDTSR